MVPLKGPLGIGINSRRQLLLVHWGPHFEIMVSYTHPLELLLGHGTKWPLTIMVPLRSY